MRELFPIPPSSPPESLFCFSLRYMATIWSYLWSVFSKIRCKCSSLTAVIMSSSSYSEGGKSPRPKHTALDPYPADSHDSISVLELEQFLDFVRSVNLDNLDCPSTESRSDLAVTPRSSSTGFSSSESKRMRSLATKVLRLDFFHAVSADELVRNQGC